MEESSTYQAILRRGRTEELRRTILALGQEKFGTPPASAPAAVEAVSDLDRLHAMVTRVLHADSWDALLNPPD